MGIADQILAAPDTQYELVDVPEWGVKLFVRSMSAQQRGDYLAGLTKGSDPSKGMGGIVVNYAPAWAFILQFCVLEAVQPPSDGADGPVPAPTPGAAVFTPDQVAQVIASKSGRAVGRLADVAVRLSGLDETAADNALGK